MHCGPSGAGRFVKMIHNGIEYGIMQPMPRGSTSSTALPAKRCRRTSAINSTSEILPSCGDAAVSSALGFSISPQWRWRKIRSCQDTRDSSRIPARGVGLSRRLSRKQCRRLSSRRHSTPVSARARRPASPTSCFRRCDMRSAAISSPRQISEMKPKPRPGDPCILVIFGAAGDLTKRLLVPALGNLRRVGLLPRKFAVIGISRRELVTRTNQCCRSDCGSTIA